MMKMNKILESNKIYIRIKESNKYSCPNNVPLHTDSDLIQIEIIEDLNPPKEPDVTDLTHLDDENEQNSGKQ